MQIHVLTYGALNTAGNLAFLVEVPGIRGFVHVGDFEALTLVWKPRFSRRELDLEGKFLQISQGLHFENVGARRQELVEEELSVAVVKLVLCQRYALAVLGTLSKLTGGIQSYAILGSELANMA